MKQNRGIIKQERGNLVTYYKHYAIQEERILYNRNGGTRAHKENQFKNRNAETYYRRLTKNIREKLIEGSYENRYFHRKQTRTNSGPETPSSRSHV